MKTKEGFHSLIDKIEDEEVLRGYFKLIQRLNAHQTGKLWDNLKLEEKEELLLSYEESLNPDNLISHSDNMINGINLDLCPHRPKSSLTKVVCGDTDHGFRTDYGYS